MKKMEENLNMENKEIKVEIKDLRTLKVYQKAIVFAHDIFELTKRYPKEEKYRITDQMLRASTSIGASLAEGVGQEYKAKTLNYCNISLGSTSEMRYWIEISSMRKYISDEEMRILNEQLDEVTRMIIGYMKMLKREINNGK